MAGTAKPNVVGLGDEASYKLIGGIGSQGAQAAGLFNGVLVNEWNTRNVMYWYEGSTYVEFEVHEECNLWRSGTASWASHNGKLRLLKHDGTSYKDVTSLYPQTVSAISHTVWEKTISKLPAGKYQFWQSGGPRIDSEWYFERTNTHFIHFKVGNELYVSESDKFCVYPEGTPLSTLLKHTKSRTIDFENTVNKIEYNNVDKVNTDGHKPFKIKLQ